MRKMDADVVEQAIRYYEWYFFGKKESDCPGIKKQLPYYKTNSKLPEPCDKCYKALIFWESKYSKTNLENFLKMIDSFDFDYAGKLNRGVVVFYFRSKVETEDFLKYLSRKMQEHNVMGITQWRRACKEYQDTKPKLWKNAKEFIGAS